MARGDAESRNKRKGKRKDNKKYPYQSGGGKRAMNISLTPSNPSKKSKKTKS